jgi:cytochrome P450/NADPH-cytochrome P450 reductase
MKAAPTAIPTPRRLPVLGHMHLFRPGRFIQELMRIASRFDGLFQLELGGPPGLVVTNAALTAELSDETRFRKMLGKALWRVRDLAGDGLFTARGDEPNWARAHRVLMPAFSQRAMRGYFPMMLEVADQLAAKWEAEPGADIQVAADMTRLTLDTISLAGFGHRFASFSQPELHPFLAAMGRVLREAMDRLTRHDALHLLYRRRARAYAADIAQMNALVDEVVRRRRAHPAEGGDLLNLMLTAADPETGERLDDLNIRYQVLTFLIAGHETTSGLLTFTLYLLMTHPGVLAQAYAEVDRILPGNTRPQYAHLARLDVIDRTLKEALRLWPTAPAYTVGPYEDTTLGGYKVPKDMRISVLLPALHRDPAVWADPETFDIDRFLPKAEAALPPHAYKPFGSGLRACIGRQFALTEAKLALAVILQRFALSDPNGYRLSILETLTLKPGGFTLRARLRRPHERLATARSPVTVRAPPTLRVAGDGRPLAVLFGTRLGTCRDIAKQVADLATEQGFAVTLAALDERLDNMPDSGMLVVVTATYNGQAPDSAARTDEAIVDGTLAGRPRPGLRYALLGCGNTLWATYQAFPTRLDDALRGSGARALLPRGEADANGDFDAAVERWLSALWQALAEAPPETMAPMTSVPE